MNKNIDIEFFNTAQLDIDSAKTLLDGAHFPQAIFSVQQCLEKTWKAIGLDSSFIGIQDLKKGGGHNFGTLFMKILKSGSGIANLNKHAPDQNQSNLESSFIQKIIENSIEDMKKFEQGFITLSDSDKMELLEMITKEPLKDSYQNFATLSDANTGQTDHTKPEQNDHLICWRRIEV